MFLLKDAEDLLKPFLKHPDFDELRSDNVNC